MVLSIKVHGQGFAIGRGATMITGLASFTSTGYSSGSDHTSVLTITPSINYFILDHFFIGGGFSYSNQSLNSGNITGLAIGPEIGYAFGKQDSKAFPYINAGWNFQSTKFDQSFYGLTDNNGSGVCFGLGMIIPLRSHVGFVLEGKYNKLNYSELNESVDVISLNFGIVGLLFK